MKKILKSMAALCILLPTASAAAFAAEGESRGACLSLRLAASGASGIAGAGHTGIYCLMGLIGAAAILLAVLYRRQNRSLKAQEHMLLNITNNIDGGVLVQKIVESAPVIFINDGLLKMLQYSREEFNALEDKYYHIRFVYPEDLPELKAMLHCAAVHENGVDSFSFHLRLIQKDGNLLPILLNCSFVNDILYCVMMDDTREHEIIKQLEFEQERYRVLFDKSDEILFDIDYAAETFSISKKFKEKFGWNPPDHYWGSGLSRMFRVYEEDEPILYRLLGDINSGQIDGECRIRIYNDKYTPRWTRVLYHVFKKDGVNYRLVGKITDIDREMKEKETLIRKAEIDALTGIYNKETFRSRCCEYLEKSPDAHVAVLFADVDNFKETNDNFGHAAGDKILKDVADKLQEIFTSDDILGRFGGDEFCVLMKDTDEESVTKVLGRLVEELRGEYINDQHIVTVSVSIGAVLSDAFGLDSETLLRDADKALYYAKENGKNNYALYREGLCLKSYASWEDRILPPGAESTHTDT